MLFAVQLLLTILSVFNNLSVVVRVVGRSDGGYFEAGCQADNSLMYMCSKPMQAACVQAIWRVQVEMAPQIRSEEKHHVYCDYGIAEV